MDKELSVNTANQAGSTPASYSGGHGFKPLSMDWLFKLRPFMIFFNSSKEKPE
jgi:hypothetical protein